MNETIRISVLLLTLVAGAALGIVIAFLGSILAIGSKASEQERKMRRDVEAEMDEIERREITR